MSLKKNFFYNSLNQILMILIPIVTVPYISRILGPENIGEYSYSYSIAYYFVMFIALGLSNYGNRIIASSKDNNSLLCKKFTSLYCMQITIGLVIVLAYVFYIVFFQKNNFIFYIQLIYVVSALFDVNWFLFGLEQFKLTSIRNILIKIISLFLILTIVKDSNDLYKYTIILSCETLISQLCVWPFIFRYIRFVKIKMNDVLQHIKPNLVLFIPVIAVSLYKIMDKVMLGYMSNMTEVGYFESAEKVIKIPLTLITSLGVVMLPRITNILAKTGNDNIIKKYMEKSIIFAMFLSTSMCFGIMSISKEFVPLFYGEDYFKCIPLFLILLPSCIFLAFSNVIRTQYLIPKKLDSVFIISVLCGAVVNLVSNTIMIPIFFSVGAAIGTLLAEMAVCIVQIYLVKGRLNIIRYIKISIPYCISGIIMFTVLWTLPILYDNLVLSLIIKIFIGILLYIVIVLSIIVIFRMIRKGKKDND